MTKNDLLLSVSRRCRVFHLVVIFFSINCLILIVFEGVNLLLKNKNISQPNFLQLPSHLITSPDCQCHRSYHIFCTDLYPEHDQDIDMIHIHPAPRNHEKSPSHRISSSCRKSRHRILEDNDHDTIVTTRSEPCHVTNTESQLSEKKVLSFYSHGGIII